MSVAYEHSPIVAIQPKRRVIASKARAAQIIEQVARKHDLAPTVVLCARWDRFAMAARSECAFELKTQLGWSQRAIAAHLGCTQPNVRKLFSFHEMNSRRARRWLPAADVQALSKLESGAMGLRLIETEERAQYLASELDRLTGHQRALELADALGVRVRGGILLAIVAEAYPNVALGGTILELYDEACLRLGYGDQKGSGFNLMAKNVAHLREHFAARGWPEPIPMGDSATAGILVGARRLSDEAAVFLHEWFGLPCASQIEAAKERSAARSPRVHAVRA